ncbi:putative disease resistance protein RGA4 isoform X2 [Eucalyptus grandis]|uniref:putative disease resistance protein RGA4 isoform X2 n=1 Tax=Eucalyptus grandis TaxID=71139 RepID=UPI00192E9E07|nr:putative disease resistance protein RGA4 isoform X2 [Eucalyptus grandis]
MAEVVTSIGGSILANLIIQAPEKVGNLGGVKRELQVLESTVTMLHSVLDDAEEQQHQSSQIKDWVEKLKEAFYDLQDVLEEFTIEVMRRELRGDNHMIKEGPMNSQAQRGRRKREETHSFIREEYIIGRGNDKKNVMKFLLDMDVKEDVSILPIVGIGGLGKTALAKFVYNDEMIGKHFDLKMWVCVSNDFDMIKIVKDIIVCVEKKEPNYNVMDRLQIELRKIIDGRRYLLVLDDLWDANLETWHNLKSLLMGGARGSKILITTRLPSVAKITSPAPPLRLEGLSESNSLDLLMQMAVPKEGGIQDPSMLAIGEEIVRKCSGVPLVIRTIGGLLFHKETKDEWLRFKDVELPKVSQRKDDIISILKLSYDNLPSHLKQCFAICSLFPKDYEIKKHTLVSLWMAEGFIQPSNSSKHLEDIAHEYFKDLLWSNFFQDFKKKPYTNEETCKMHDLMHDLACNVAGNRCWVARDDTNQINERTRHISYGSTFNLMGELPISRLKPSVLRTFLCTIGGWGRNLTSEVDLSQLIQNFKRLRILDLHATTVKKVPRSICELKYLTYLDLSYNKTLRRLPNSITRLQSLQTLNLYCCHALEKLPSDIKKLVNLRNLDIVGCSTLSYLPRGMGEISSLHRLTNFILPKDKARAKNYCGLGELKGLNNIQGQLSIENLGYVTNVEVKCEDEILMGKHSLESLVLNWGDFNSLDEVLFDRLKPPSNLQKLKIGEYKGETFPKWMMDSLVSFLPHLVHVSFDACKRCERLPPLGQLPCLKSLYIFHMPKLEYIESDQSSPSLASFPSLLELKIYGCEKLKAIPLTPHLEELALTEANGALLINQMMLGLNKLKRLEIRRTNFPKCLPEEAFQSLTSLESLNISCCSQLTSLSQGIRHLSSLVDLTIRMCDELDISKDESGNFLDFHGGLHSLRSVWIDELPKLTFLPEWLLQACSLECLDISNCPNFKELSEQIEKCEKVDKSKDESGNILDFHDCFQSLRSVDIFGLPQLTSLPQWLLQASNLKRLYIGVCDNLKDIPEQIEAFQSLQILNIDGCSSLTSFPKAMQRLTSLTHLWIHNCGELEKSCKRKVGEDWDKIARIPNIEF